MRGIGTSWAEGLRGLFAIVLALFTPFLRSRRQRWGAREGEIDATHPGDDLVAEPKWRANHAISIDAPPKRVWPWIAQIGQGRGGFYTYQKLENLAGCEIENSSRILPEHQEIRRGDPIRLHVKTPPMTVSVVDEPTALVLHGNPAEEGGGEVSSSWAFLLLEQANGTTRLLSRTRYHYGDGFLSRLLGGPFLIEPISFVMERKMLKVIKLLAESPQTSPG